MPKMAASGRPEVDNNVISGQKIEDTQMYIVTPSATNRNDHYSQTPWDKQMITGGL